MAVRHSALSLSGGGEASYLKPGDWVASVSYRWLHSDRHFRSDHEEAFRQERGDEVINDVHSIELSATRAFTRRFSVSLTIPFVYADRSSKYEHLGGSAPTTPRFTTHASGLGDVRVVGTTWLLNPETHPNGNIAVGLGLKAPTGEFGAEDDFVRRVGGRQVLVRRPVDQSIQPGDGGWGAVIEVQAFQRLWKNTFGYVNGSYLINPRNVNGVQTPNSTPSNITVLSVPDQYMGRAGVTCVIWPSKGLALSLGGRVEGVPVRDLMGANDGFRRPGMSVGIEPGIAWSHGRHHLSVTAPVAVYRNRERSVLDIQRNNPGGDAAFADYVIYFSYALRF